ncbi:hypothetical protein VCR5J5_300036 [Vibrio crassostreae]|uniref:Uncharacterized protein n=1 Tax=Vibrio crassostreae TaxID=246167 RepID=A0A822N1X3_9VIBR|nr:hypothetical protein VCR5J5_300036 [Vibrio crassostreae]
MSADMCLERTLLIYSTRSSYISSGREFVISPVRELYQNTYSALSGFL